MQIPSGAVGYLYSHIFAPLSSAVGASSLLSAFSLVIALIIFAIILGIAITLYVYLIGWGERKIMGRIHSRHGPTYVGKFGILQNMADVIKLLSKEHIAPDNADKPLFFFVLPITYAIFFIIFAFIPFNSASFGVGGSLGLIAIFALLSLTPLLMFLLGWTSGNKFGSISAQRSVMVMLAYEVPMLLVVASVAMLSGSYSLVSIVNSQSSMWYGILMPIGFFVFFVVMLAEVERPPFDMSEADNELIAGWLTDVSAPYYSIALFLDYTRMFFGTMLIALLFLGGWSGPSVLPQSFWLLAKVFILTIFIILIRVSMVRMKIGRVLRSGWLYLMPLAVINMLITFMIFVR
ncbi:MAG: complex I subunit 1 family protein [Candidatus Micrarchaeaceae archaeon]